MNDTHFIDPQVRAALGYLEASFGDYTNMSIEEIRSRFAEHAKATARPLPDGCEQGDFLCPGPAGPIACRYFKPAGQTRLPVVAHFLGGTFVTTSLDQVGHVPVAIAMATGSVVVTPLHRMPPEHPFPAAYDDCFAVYRWLIDHAEEIGGDGARIVTLGESSGATLATSVCIDARDAGAPQPVLQVLAEPLVDHESETPSMNEFTYVLSKEMMRPPVTHYFGADRPPLRASPLRARSLAGLAPAYVITAGLDPLRDEGIAYVARLRREGVVVAHRHHDGQIHGFFSMYEQLLQSKIAFAECCAVMRLAFDGGLAPAAA